jgi:hypothetical protein
MVHYNDPPDPPQAVSTPFRQGFQRLERRMDAGTWSNGRTSGFPAKGVAGELESGLFRKRNDGPRNRRIASGDTGYL